MTRKIFLVIILVLSVGAIAYGGFFRQFVVYDNLEKFDKLKSIGIKIKVPGYQQKAGPPRIEREWFTEPEVVNAMTFSGIGVYKDGRLISYFPDLRMLRGRRPCAA